MDHDQNLILSENNNLLVDYFEPGGGHSHTLLLFVVLKKYHRFCDFDQTHIHPGGNFVCGFWSGFWRSIIAAALWLLLLFVWVCTASPLFFLFGGAGLGWFDCASAGGAGFLMDWTGRLLCFGVSVTAASSCAGGDGGCCTSSIELSSESFKLVLWRDDLETLPLKAASPSPSASMDSNTSSREGEVEGVLGRWDSYFSGTNDPPRFSSKGLPKLIAMVRKKDENHYERLKNDYCQTHQVY